MRQYAVVFERTARAGPAALVPDLPDLPDQPACAAIGRTRELAARRFREAIDLHVAGDT